MTTRVVRTELRRSTAPWLGLLLTALTLGILFGFSGPWTKGSGAWTEQWTGLALAQREASGFTWPVVLGLGAWQGSRQRRSTMDDLVAAAPRPAWHQAAVQVAAMTIALAVAVAVPFAVGVVRVAGNTEYVNLDWLPILAVGLLCMVAGTVAGMAIGHLLPHVVTPPLVALGGLVLDGILANAPAVPSGQRPLPLQVELLSPWLHVAPSAFVTVAGSVHWGQSVFFLGLAATGFALLAVRSVRARLLAGLPVLLGLVLALAVLPAVRTDAYPDDPGAAELVCDTSGPEVCVTAAHQNLLPTVVGPARQALADLAVLPNAPRSVREVSDRPAALPARVARPADVVQFAFDSGESRWRPGEDIDPGRLRLRLLVGAGTLPCSGHLTNSREDPGQAAARLAVVGWLAGDPTQSITAARPAVATRWPSVVRQAEHARAALLAQPYQEQARRVAALRQAGLTCHGDQWRILTDGAGEP